MGSSGAGRESVRARRSTVSKERYCVFNLTRQAFLSLGVSIADTQWGRLRGLIGRLRLRCDEGLWVVPSQGVHTIGLTFPIDVVYLDANSRVIHVVEHLGPFRAGPLRRRSRSVLELPTRSVFCSNTQIGDQFLICPAEELASQLVPQAGAPPGGGQVESSQPGPGPATPTSGSNGHWGARLRRWLWPVGERRRAGRSPLSGVAAYYWEGGVPEPHDVLNMSESGAFIRATRSWYPGTIIELTLQQKIVDLEKRSDWRASVTVSGRVVRSGVDGIGMQFLYTHSGDRLGVRKFLAAMKEGGS
jgi:uncharacterized membrane protein (UPF0127 family)